MTKAPRQRAGQPRLVAAIMSIAPDFVIGTDLNRSESARRVSGFGPQVECVLGCHLAPATRTSMTTARITD